MTRVEESFSLQMMEVVAAAREWAASIWSNNERLPVEFMNEPPTVSICTEEERTRVALLDAVHDLNHRTETFPRSLPPLFLEID